MYTPVELMGRTTEQCHIKLAATYNEFVIHFSINSISHAHVNKTIFPPVMRKSRTTYNFPNPKLKKNLAR